MMNIEQACEHFKVLLLEQQKRLETLEKEKKDYSKRTCVTIGLVDGDGIGPIIMEEAVRVLEKCGFMQQEAFTEDGRASLYYETK